MAKYIWCNDLVPNTIKVKQVYGIAFTNDFRILLRIEDNKYKLTVENLKKMKTMNKL